MWIKAAVWEYRHNPDIATARTCRRAIRLNKAAKNLWIEYFRLELDYKKVRARRSILGLTTGSEGVEPAQSSSGEKPHSESNATDEDDDNSDDPSVASSKNEGIAQNASASFLQGAVPFIVYQRMFIKSDSRR